MRPAAPTPLPAYLAHRKYVAKARLLSQVLDLADIRIES